MTASTTSSADLAMAGRAWTRLGEQIDRLVTVEMRPAIGSVPAGLVRPLYDLCRGLQGAPLSTSAADTLIALRRGSTVLIATGAGVAPDLPAGETDGPPGAAVLAAVLRDALGLKPRFVTEPAHAPAVRECAAVMGFESESTLDQFERSTRPQAWSQAADLLAAHAPAAVVFIERDGANPEERYHGVRGNCRPIGSVAHIDVLAEAARTLGTKTIGIGDGGNEVGFGRVREAVNKLYPGGGECASSCVTGRATSRTTDILVSAGVSNWGAYGLALAVAASAGSLDSFPQASVELELFGACLNGGARDGADGKASLSADGISAVASRSVIELLREIGMMFIRSEL